MHRIIKEEIVLITPQYARELLERNFWNKRQQRQLQEKRVLMMKKWIEFGIWQTDRNKSIGIDRKGNLINGQHRLSAIVLADRPVSQWVFTYDMESDVNND